MTMIQYKGKSLWFIDIVKISNVHNQFITSSNQIHITQLQEKSSKISDGIQSTLICNKHFDILVCHANVLSDETRLHSKLVSYM